MNHVIKRAKHEQKTARKLSIMSFINELDLPSQLLPKTRVNQVF